MTANKFTKADLVDAVYGKTGMERKDIRFMLDVFVHEIKSALSRGSVIELRGFGTFEVKVRKPRPNARNPKTGEAVVARQRGAVSFRPGRELRLGVWGIGEVADAEGENTGGPEADG